MDFIGDLEFEGARMIRSACSLLAGLAVAMTAAPATAQENDPGYIAGWQALAHAEQKDLQVAESHSVPIVTLRPDRLFTVGGPVVENGKTLLAAGTAMIGIAGRDNVACEFERRRGKYASLCVEDKDRDGRFETAFFLNHANPFLFSALRLRGASDHSIQPVSLAEAPRDGVPVQMVLHYFNHSGIIGGSTFELCVLRANNRNLWGDKNVARGCLPQFLIRDGAFPKMVPVLGREILFLARDAKSVTVTVSAADADQPVRL